MSHPASRRFTRLAAATVAGTFAVLVTSPPVGHAFMSWDPPGQGEHERITRMAIACNSGLDRASPGDGMSGMTWQDLCLPSRQPGDSSTSAVQRERSLRMLAGGSGYLGGVGAPDSIAGSLDSDDAAHCDNADAWLPATPWPLGSGYPRSAADRDGALRTCLTRLQQYVGVAVDKAGQLVESDGSLNLAQVDLSADCATSYDPKTAADESSPDTAKCQSLIAFGRALHITQDFFSHSNWTDAEPTQPGPGQPPGLLESPTTVPAVLGFPRSPAQIDSFLAATQVITGAYPCPTTLLLPNCDTTGRDSRLYHDYFLNKDAGSGYIDWTRAQIPTGQGPAALGQAKGGRGARGLIDGQDNFQRAVIGAAYASAALWTDLHREIQDRYGAGRGSRIWNALRESTPWTQCEQYGDARRAIAPPTGVTRAARTLRVRLVNETSRPLDCSSARLDWGEWSSLPPDTVGPGDSAEFMVLSNGTLSGLQGRYSFTGGGLDFDVPYLGGNRYSCTGSAVRCSLTGGTGNDATLTVTVRETSGARSVSVARRSDGKAAARHRGRQFAVTTGRDLNERLPRRTARSLADEVQGMRPCEGRGRAISLSVDEVRCPAAVRLLTQRVTDGYADLCPTGWRHLNVSPRAWGVRETESTVCHQRRAGPPVRDRAARVFRYSLAHAHDGGHDR